MPAVNKRRSRSRAALDGNPVASQCDSSEAAMASTTMLVRKLSVMSGTMVRRTARSETCLRRRRARISDEETVGERRTEPAAGAGSAQRTHHVGQIWVRVVVSSAQKL